MAFIIHIGGIPGAGKSTTCLTLSKNLEDCAHISAGEIKRPQSEVQFGKRLSLLDQQESYAINEWFFNNFFKQIAQEDKKTYLIDTHYTYPQPDRHDLFVKLLPEQFADKIDLFVLLEANPEEVIKRRTYRGRDRDRTHPLEWVKLEFNAEREEALRLSRTYSVPLEIISTEKALDSVITEFKIAMAKYQ